MNKPRKIFTLLITLVLLYSSREIATAAPRAITLTVQDRTSYEYDESPDFPSGLKQSEINFVDQLSECKKKGGYGSYAHVILASGRELPQVPITGKGKIANFKWKTNESGESYLYFEVICTKSVKLNVVSSNAYSIHFGDRTPTWSDENSENWINSPFYTVAELNAAKWQVKLSIPLDDAYYGANFKWSLGS